MSKRIIPQHLRDRQMIASDPAASIWVSANAGSGKTHVLTQRVIRLLLGGVAPSKILCLTFTKAAAAQMATRVFDTLSRWTALDDSALREAVVETGAQNPTATDLLLARRLFTRTVETPGGLKIQTIHAFCERLLHLFPFEANVPARFEVADELRAQEMLARAKRAAIEAAQRSMGPLKTALQLVAELAGPTGIDPLIATAMRLRAPVRRHPHDLQPTLGQRLGASAASVADVRRTMVEDGLAPNRWPEIAVLLDGGSSNDQKQAARLREAVATRAREAATGDILETLGVYLTIFFDAKDKPRPALVTKGMAGRHPSLAAELEAEQDRLVGLREELRSAEAIERTRALLDLVDATTDNYERAKSAAGVLDFDDLIERTLALLARSEAGWVLHKLDAGIDHVLVDEAQDTSEAQWKILESLTGDFAAGHGGNAQKRSFFVVGDDKQSIFSFQGAAPLMFDTMRAEFERRFKAGRKPFERVSLKTSFRSVPGILAAVDQVFASEAHRDGMVQRQDIWPIHESIKTHLPGLVEIWPRVAATAAPDPQDWSIPLDTPSEQDPTHIVADRVARKIKHLTSPHSGEWAHDERGAQRPIRPGDILILVRTRNAFFEAVIRALKRHYVDVAGADRLDVANHIAVMDLVTAGRTALLPQDDLSLAALLKSPLFGFTDDDLLAIAPGRRGALIDALARSADSRHRSAHATIRGWAARAAGATPFAFYIELLGRDGGRRLMEARLGPEAHDAIDEFLRLALAHEQQGAPSLVTFLDDVEALERSIRRDMEGPGDAVRVMTVHAAKGLEAKVVFLPDTCQVPSLRFDPTIFDLNKASGEAPVLVWSPRKADDPHVVVTARAAERRETMREYRRLLYVGLTRAEERLYVAGFYNAREPPGDCWNAMIDAAFGEAEEVPAFWDADETIRRVASPGTAQPGTRVAGEQHPLRLAPDWLFRPVEATAVAASLRPSQRVHDPAPERRRRLAFGSAVHLLLQYLPGLPAERREAQGRGFLAQRRDSFDPAQHEAILAEALAVLDLPALGPLFAPQARAEVAVIGRVAQPDGSVRSVNAIVDRLVVGAERVIVVDFKTGAPDARAEADYLRQLSLYRDVLAPLWPRKPLAMWLVWTRDARIVDLDGGA